MNKDNGNASSEKKNGLGHKYAHKQLLMLDVLDDEIEVEIMKEALHIEKPKLQLMDLSECAFYDTSST